MSYFKSDTITVEAALRDVREGSPKARVAAAAALAEVPAGDRKAATEALTEALTGNGPLNLRVVAARSLGDLGQASAIGPLGEAIDADEPPLRQAAAIALGELGLRDGFDLLETALADSPPDVRFQAARSLVEIDPDRASTVLRAAIEREDDHEVLGALALGLGEIGDPEAADLIAAHLTCPRAETRFEVAYSLALLKDKRGVETLAEASADREHAWDAIEGLELAGGAEAARALTQIFTRRKLAAELSLRAAAAIIVVDPDGDQIESARAALLSGLSAWKHHLRGLATGELGRVGGTWALSDLRRLRGRRRGLVLLEEIDDAIASITQRAEQAESS